MSYIRWSMKKEEEAEKLVCPLNRHPTTVVSGSYCSVDVNFDSGFTSNCIAAKCNLWIKTGQEEDHIGWCGLSAS